MDHGPATDTAFRVPTATAADGRADADGPGDADGAGDGEMALSVSGTGRSSIGAPPSTPRSGSPVVTVAGVLAAAWTDGGGAAETGGVPRTEAAMATADKSTGIAIAACRFHGRSAGPRATRQVSRRECWTQPFLAALSRCDCGCDGVRGGQGQDRTVDLPIFSRTLVPTELPGQTPKGPRRRHTRIGHRMKG